MKVSARLQLVWVFPAVLLPFLEALPATVNPGDRRIYVDGSPLHMKGVNWNPVPRGMYYPRGLRFLDFVQKDARLMAEAGINVLRTYEPIHEIEVLDVLWKNGIQVLNTVYASAAASVDGITAKVNAVKNHPALLMWVVGNEWNYNGCYMRMSVQSCGDRLNEVAAVIKRLDSQHPVASVYGEVPPVDVINRMNNVDVWGINYYDDLSFGDLFKRWADRSTKPLFIGEYGADAYDAHQRSENAEAQALATRLLTQEIMDHSVVWEAGVCSGGLIFELADEWWKDMSGSVNAQDIGGVAPGGGPHPDRVFNEEWWGLTTLDRVPRKAYYEYARLAIPQPVALLNLMAQGTDVSEGTRRSCTMQGCTLVPKKREDLRCSHGSASKVPQP